MTTATCATFSAASLANLLGSVEVNLPKSLQDEGIDRTLSHVTTAFVNPNTYLKRKASSMAGEVPIQSAAKRRRRKSFPSLLSSVSPSTHLSEFLPPDDEPTKEDSIQESLNTTKDLCEISDVLQALNRTKRREFELMKQLEKVSGSTLSLTTFSFQHPHCGLRAFHGFLDARITNPVEVSKHPFVMALREYFVYPALTFNGILHKNLDKLASTQQLILTRMPREQRRTTVACSVCNRDRQPSRIVMDANRPSKKGPVCRTCHAVLSSIIRLHELIITINEDYTLEMQPCVQLEKIGKILHVINKMQRYDCK